MGKRLDLHELLKAIPGVEKVYFQPPSDIYMEYPCIVYERDYRKTQHADNRPYLSTLRYEVTIIDRDPDSAIPEAVAALPLSLFTRHFQTDSLNHDVYNVYY